MRTRLPFLASFAVVGAIALSGCASPASDDPAVISPVIMAADELQGESVELRVGQGLDITTGDLAPDSYSAQIANPDVASFSKGGEREGATFNPGILGESVGETDVTLTNDDGGIEPVQFTVTVVE